MASGEVILDFSSVETENQESKKLDLDPLVPEQEEIFKGGIFNRLVDAGPATGKTRVTTNFVRYLVKEGMDPKKILPVSYTKTAVKVFESRCSLAETTTLHAHGYRHSKEARESFIKTKDFDELLVKGSGYYDFVICDEAQDLTRKQYEALMQKGRNFLLVGDKWQAIHMWNGADPTIMDTFPAERSYSLITNHRSKEEIVKIGNLFSGRDMVADRRGGKVTIGWDSPELKNLTILVRKNVEVENWSTTLASRGLEHTRILTYKGIKEIINWSKGQEKRVSRNFILPLMVCTIHNSKGDEWDNVLLDYRPPFGGCNLEEERRIFYVGLTRAREELYIRPNYGPFIRKIT